MEYPTVELNAALLKKVDQMVKENTQGEVGGFDLFFELLANLAMVETENPVQIFNAFMDPNQEIEEIQKILGLYSDFHNAIIIAFDVFAEGKPFHHLKKNLFNLIKAEIPKSLEDEYLSRHILVSLMRPLMLFMKSHDLVIENVNELKTAMREKFDAGEQFIEDMVDTLMLNTLAQTKELSSNDFGLRPSEFVRMMIENVLALSVAFLEIRKEHTPKDAEGSIQVETGDIGGLSTYNGINYDGVEKNDPCPCGSGKKYKKCCRKAWEYPLSTLSPQKVLFKPKLTVDEVKEFYRLFDKLMVFVQNDYAIKHKKKQLSRIFIVQYDGTYATDSSIDFAEIAEFIKHLNSHKDLVVQFVERYQSELAEEELKIYREWVHFVSAECMIMQSHNDAQVFAWEMKKHKVYLVYGLYDPLSSLVPKYPFFADMTLFPYKGRVVFSGLLLGQNIDFGNNILRAFVADYEKDIQENGIVLEITP